MLQRMLHKFINYNAKANKFLVIIPAYINNKQDTDILECWQFLLLALTSNVWCNLLSENEQKIDMEAKSRQ